jgi:hypothetical protein
MNLSKTSHECCIRMGEAISLACKDHSDPIDCPDALLLRRADGSTGLIVHDGGSATIGIAFCPWCGSGLRTAEEPLSLSRLALIELVGRIRSEPLLAEGLLDILAQHVPHASPSDLIFYPPVGEELGDTQVVDLALTAKPIIL